MMPLNHILRKCTAWYKLLMYMDDIKLFAKNPNTNCENMQSRYRNGIWHRKMRHASNEKWQPTHDGMSQTTKSNSNQNAWRSTPINTWEYWKLTPSNKWKWKKRLKKSISEEPENYSRQNSIVGTLSKEYIPGLSASKDIRGYSWSGSEKNLNKWTREQEK